MEWRNIVALLLSAAVVLPLVRKLWRMARSGVDPASEKRERETVETRALLEALEQYDRRLAQPETVQERGGPD